MNQKDIVEFFNSAASQWDAEMIRDDDIINTILDNCGVKENSVVLDVACGTGVLFPDYLKRKVKSVTGIDISEEMLKFASEKYSDDERIRLIKGDAVKENFDKSFDCIVIYNAFPHFEDPDALISNLCKYLAMDGRLTVAHGMSREHINRHHEGMASHVSQKLMEADALAELFSKYLTVEAVISDEKMYQVTGRKK